MAFRALVMFVVLLVITRLGGVRIFSSKSPFDSVLAIVLGAVAARGIVGASPFGSCTAACCVLVLVHYAVGWFQYRSERFGQLVSGSPLTLYRKSELIRENLERTVVSEEDLLQSARLETGRATLDEVEEAVTERNGRISFVRKR
jgi:uncharacterized membrane protein YcaP (DUF421 family)